MDTNEDPLDDNAGLRALERMRRESSLFKPASAYTPARPKHITQEERARRKAKRKQANASKRRNARR